MGILPDLGDPSDPAVRTRYGYLQAGVSIGTNLGLFATKLVLAGLVSSVAVLTDAFNGLGDVAISVMILVVFRFSGLEADPDHPYGHGRLEHIATVVVAAFLIFVGIVLLVRSALELGDPRVEGSLSLALVLAALAGVKEGLARFTFAVADRVGSDALRGDGWNHRFDAVLTGSIALAIYLAALSPALRVLDPLFGLVVAGVVAYTGGHLMRSAVSRLLGRAPDPALRRRIEELAGSVDGVQGAHDVSVHEYGVYKVVSLTVRVAGDLSVREAHAIATRVERAIGEALRAEATVHVEPAKDGDAGRQAR